MQKQVSFSTAIAVALLVGTLSTGCGSEELLQEEEVASLDSDLTLNWDILRYLPTAFKAYDSVDWVKEARLWSGNYVTATGKIEYRLELDRCFFTCWTDKYVVSVGRTGAMNESLSYIVVDTTNTADVLELRVTPNAGAKLYYDGTELAQDADYGPFVRDAFVPGAEGLFLGVDQQVLSRFKSPTTANGSYTLLTTYQTAASAVYNDLVKARTSLIDTFRFRMNLGAPRLSTRTQKLSDLIRTKTESTHANEPFWHAHVEVNHAVALETPPSGEFVVEHGAPYFYGGFFNGHRTYMRQMEDGVRAANVKAMPFGRMPLWKSDSGVPTGFTLGTSSAVGDTASRLPATVRPGAICQSFATASSLLSVVAPWHNGVHGTIEGTWFGSVHDAAHAPLFFPWHTAVDQLWANWQQCLK